MIGLPLWSWMLNIAFLFEEPGYVPHVYLWVHMKITGYADIFYTYFPQSTVNLGLVQKQSLLFYSFAF